jgi:hypothetical protein
MEKLPTAEEFLKEAQSNPTKGWTTHKAMIEFAKLHVEAALKEASEKATWQNESFDTYFGDLRNFDFIDTDGAGDPSTGHNVFVDKDSILNSYSLEKIK